MTGKARGGGAGRAGAAHLPGAGRRPHPSGLPQEGPGGSSAPGGRGGARRSRGFDSSHAGSVPSSPSRWEETRCFNFACPGLIPHSRCRPGGWVPGRLPFPRSAGTEPRAGSCRGLSGSSERPRGPEPRRRGREQLPLGWAPYLFLS